MRFEILAQLGPGDGAITPNQFLVEVWVGAPSLVPEAFVAAISQHRATDRRATVEATTQEWQDAVDGIESLVTADAQRAREEGFRPAPGKAGGTGDARRAGRHAGGGTTPTRVLPPTIASETL